MYEKCSRWSAPAVAKPPLTARSLDRSQSFINNSWCLVLIKRHLVVLHPQGEGGTQRKREVASSLLLCKHSNHFLMCHLFPQPPSLLNLHPSCCYDNAKQEQVAGRGIHWLFQIFVTLSILRLFPPLSYDILRVLNHEASCKFFFPATWPPLCSSVFSSCWRHCQCSNVG